MYKIAKNLSPFTLGLVFCFSQTALLPTAHAASLNPNSSVDATLSLDPNTANQTALDPTGASSPTALPAGLPNVDCLQSGLSPSQGSAVKSESMVPGNSGITPIPKNSGDTSLKYQSNEIASSDVPATEPVSNTTQEAKTTSPTLIAQASAAEDCCGIGGAATCEVGGVPTGGAGLGGVSPLLGLLGLLPAGAIPFITSGNSNSDPNQTTPIPAPVPESSSTGAIVAGFGMMGLLLSRRYLSGRKNKNVNPE